MKRLLLLLLLLLHSSYSYAANHQPSLPPPGSWQIISDYGPRNHEHWWHGGIDYLAPKGSDFHAVEDGTITLIKRSGSWYVKVKGYNAYWDYFHLFRDSDESTYTSPVTGKKWEWRNATLEKQDTGDTITSPVIILWSETPVVFSAENDRWIQNDDGTYIQDSSGNRIKTRNTVTTGDFFAATGDSGTGKWDGSIYLTI